MCTIMIQRETLPVQKHPVQLNDSGQGIPPVTVEKFI